MAKEYDFEISTRMSITEPEEFRSELAMLGAQVFDKPRQSGYYIADHRGVGVRPKDQHFHAIERLRYVHFDRVIEPFGEIGLHFTQLQFQIDPALRGEETIGGIDLNCDIAKELHRRIGEYSIKGQGFIFDKIDDIPSDRTPESRLFVLRKQKDPTTVNPLSVVSEFVSQKIEELNSVIFNHGTDSSREVEDGLIIGYTTDTNPDRIKTFKEKFTKRLIGKDKLHAEAHDVEVHSKMQF